MTTIWTVTSKHVNTFILSMGYCACIGKNNFKDKWCVSTTLSDTHAEPTFTVLLCLSVSRWGGMAKLELGIWIFFLQHKKSFTFTFLLQTQSTSNITECLKESDILPSCSGPFWGVIIIFKRKELGGWPSIRPLWCINQSDDWKRVLWELKTRLYDYYYNHYTMWHLLLNTLIKSWVTRVAGVATFRWGFPRGNGLHLLRPACTDTLLSLPAAGVRAQRPETMSFSNDGSGRAAHASADRGKLQQLFSQNHLHTYSTEGHTLSATCRMWAGIVLIAKEKWRVCVIIRIPSNI